MQRQLCGGVKRENAIKCSAPCRGCAFGAKLVQIHVHQPARQRQITGCEQTGVVGVNVDHFHYPNAPKSGAAHGIVPN